MNNEVIIDILRAQGYRITKARENIIHILCAGGHYNIERIIKALECNGDVNVATVYNNVKFLVEEGIINEYAFNGKHPVYELNIGIHAHLVCKICGDIENVELPALTHLQEIVEDNTGFHIESNKLEFYGQCLSCLAEKER